MIWLLILLAPPVLLAYLYNRLVRARNRVDGAWSDIDVQLQRRHDLIPQLVTAVDQYASYEKATIEAVTVLRTEAMNAHSLEARSQAEEGLSEGLVRLIALAEQYPDLKANENFLSLQFELVETEDYLQFARRYYNGSVRELNTSIQTVPSNFVAQLFGFSEKEYFQLASDEVAAVPLVKLASVE
jgi:LemA protein